MNLNYNPWEINFRVRLNSSSTLLVGDVEKVSWVEGGVLDSNSIFPKIKNA